MKFIANVFAYLIIPVLFFLHYKTGNSAFIYLYFLLVIFVGVMLPFVGVMLSYMYNEHFEKYQEHIVEMCSKFTLLKTSVSLLYSIGAFSYLVYAHCFWTATAVLVVMFETYVFRSVVKQQGKKHEAHVSLRKAQAALSGGKYDAQ